MDENLIYTVPGCIVALLFIFNIIPFSGAFGLLLGILIAQNIDYRRNIWLQRIS